MDYVPQNGLWEPVAFKQQRLTILNWNREEEKEDEKEEEKKKEEAAKCNQMTLLMGELGMLLVSDMSVQLFSPLANE